MDRREFLARAGHLAFWATVPVVLSACGEDKKEPTDPGGGNNGGDVTGAISANHGHTVKITRAQINAAAGVTLTLTEGAGHTHTVSLDASQVASIGTGGRVSKTSTNDDGHTHGVTFN